jgi:hypothetical protein
MPKKKKLTNKEQLQEEAKALGVTFTARTKVGELKALIDAAKGDEATIPVDAAPRVEVVSDPARDDTFEESSYKVKHEVANAIITLDAETKMKVIEARKEELTAEHYQDLLSKV